MSIVRLAAVFLVVAACGDAIASAAEAGRWSPERAREWRAKTGWLVGCNYAPASAINQLEMWQADTFDPERIDRELGWAAGLGFNSVRVFLHDIPFAENPGAFLDRIERFLGIADRHGIGVMFVFFDSVWDPFPKAGRQREPRKGVHNSGWVQSPGKEILADASRHDALAPYVRGVVGRFKDDARVHAWDIFNELDNRNDAAYGTVELTDKAGPALALAAKAVGWAREAGPSQPITLGVWLTTWGDPAAYSPMERFCLESSDVVSFHNYDGPVSLEECIRNLRRHGRPILCTEYMARPKGSTFDPLLGIMKREGVAAYNWGFVQGKSQTIFPWDSWQKPYDGEPPVWFHDIFRTDGTPYRPEEVSYIRSVTGKVGR